MKGGKIMITKKGQSEMITTIILVLVALAAIALIAAFVMNQVKTSSSTAASKADCLKLSFTIDKATNASSDNLAISRDTDDKIAVKELRLYINDKSNGTLSGVPNVLEKSSYTVEGLNAGDVVKIYPVLNGSDTVCDGLQITKTVAAA